MTFRRPQTINDLLSEFATTQESLHSIVQTICSSINENVNLAEFKEISEGLIVAFEQENRAGIFYDLLDLF